MRRHPRGGTIAPCPGPCFALRRETRLVSLVCLAADLIRARRRTGAELRLAGEAREPGVSGPVGCRAAFTFSAYGVRVGIRANDARVLAVIRDRLPPAWRPVRARTVDRVYSLVVPRHRGFHTLYCDTARLVRTRTLDWLLDSFESDLELAVAERAPRRVFVHAGVVGWGGRAILLPGRSLSGKSTLVAELVRTGATYYSDEYAVLDARGRVHPYARRLSLRAAGTGERRRYSAASLGGRTGRPPLPVGLVILSRYSPRARWRPRRLSAGPGALALMAHTVPVRRDPRRALTAIQQVVLRAPVLRGVRGEAAQTARALIQALGEITLTASGDAARLPSPASGEPSARA